MLIKWRETSALSPMFAWFRDFPWRARCRRLIQKKARKTGPRLVSLKLTPAQGSIAARQLRPIAGQLVFLSDAFVLESLDFRFQLPVPRRQVVGFGQ